MYAVLWRALPGPVALKVVWVLLLVGLVVWACFTWLFPIVAEHLPWGDNTVDTGSAAAAPAWTDGGRTAYGMDTGGTLVRLSTQDLA